jgi:1-acyl-sn-glycerol-3-phosphate acyltransferase
MVLATYGIWIFFISFKMLEKILPINVSGPLKKLWMIIVRRLCGLRLEVAGTPLKGGGALVANHCSWIDIFSLGGAHEVAFISKAEVRNWPLVGYLSSTIDTFYVTRKSSEAKKQQAEMERRMKMGQRLCFFPEGTSTDGQRVIDFKSTLFAGFFADGIRERLVVQPVAITYFPSDGLAPEFFGWWGATTFGSHVKAVLGYGRGKVRVEFLDPVNVRDFTDRKALAKFCGDAVRHAFEMSRAS